MIKWFRDATIDETRIEFWLRQVIFLDICDTDIDTDWILVRTSDIFEHLWHWYWHWLDSGYAKWYFWTPVTLILTLTGFWLRQVIFLDICDTDIDTDWILVTTRIILGHLCSDIDTDWILLTTSDIFGHLWHWYSFFIYQQAIITDWKNIIILPNTDSSLFRFKSCLSIFCSVYIIEPM